MATPREMDSAVETAGQTAERQGVMAFAADADTEAALRQGLRAAGVFQPTIHRGDIDRAMSMLRTASTPEAVIVDVGGHRNPLSALKELTHIIEPDTRLLVIGDDTSIDFYRHITQDIGVLEYLYKPLSAASVTQMFGPLLQGRAGTDWGRRGGRVITVAGARGGVGATTIALHLAWFFAERAGRHTVLLDADPRRGTAAMALGLQPDDNLRTALKLPQDLTDTLVRRTAIPATDRLHLLATREDIAQPLDMPPDAAERLLNILRRNYHLIVVDTGYGDGEFRRDIANLSHQRIVVMDPSLAAMRDAARLVQMPGGPWQTHRPLLVLNRADRKGGIGFSDLAATMRQTPDVIVPELPARLTRDGLPIRPSHDDSHALTEAVVTLAYESGIGGPNSDGPRKIRLLGWRKT